MIPLENIKKIINSYEALEKELRRFRVEITKDRNSADGVLKASIEKFNAPKVSTIPYPMINSTVMVEINLDLYQTGFENSVWNGTLKGTPNFSSQAFSPFQQGINTALNEAIKQWYNYPGFKEALVKLAGNATSPSSPQPPKSKDVAIARRLCEIGELSQSLFDRVKLDEAKIEQMAISDIIFAQNLQKIAILAKF